MDNVKVGIFMTITLDIGHFEHFLTLIALFGKSWENKEVLAGNGLASHPDVLLPCAL